MQDPFEEARESRRHSDLQLTPLERLIEAEAAAVLEAPDPRRIKVRTLCEVLNRHGARYVLVGSTAGTLWGYVRATKDIDVLIDATEDNASRVIDALTDIGFILTRDLDPREVASRPITTIADLFRVDLLTLAWKVRYPEAAKTQRVFDIDGVAIPAISLELLIESKRTNRLQDQADVEELEILRARLHNNP